MRVCWLVLCLSVGLGSCLTVSEEDTPVQPHGFQTQRAAAAAFASAATATVSSPTSTTAVPPNPTEPPTTPPTRIAKAKPPTHDDVEKQTTPMAAPDDHGSTKEQEILTSSTTPTINTPQQITTKPKPFQKEKVIVEYPPVKIVPNSPKPSRQSATLLRPADRRASSSTDSNRSPVDIHPPSTAASEVVSPAKSITTATARKSLPPPSPSMPNRRVQVAEARITTSSASNPPAQHQQQGVSMPIPVPELPLSYEVSMDVEDVYNNESFRVRERERDGRAQHALTSDALNVSCIYNTLTAEGYIVEGVKCIRYSTLPSKCFCVTKFCRKYVALAQLLDYLKHYNATATQTAIGSGLEVVVWQVHAADMKVEATYSRAVGGGQLSPLTFTVKGSGRVFRFPGGALWLRYTVRTWARETDPAHVLVATPPGVFCPAHERKFLPKLANQFSITMETVIENLGTIAYESQHYESEEKLVSFTYRPHLHAEGMFLLNIPGLTDMTIESYRVIHDFKTGIQYMINEKTSNCSIQGIPVSALDAAPADNQHIRLRHASELISIDPNMFIYKGTRRVRGIICDVWVAERGVRKGQYSTVEIYFSHENWTVEVEVFNKVRQVPIGISSYIADADNPSSWSSIVHTFFYEYSDGHPSWRPFDISPCLNRINRLFLILTLEVSYSELVHYNLEAAKNSIRRAVAGIAGVSPLRVTDLFLSSRVASEEVDVWFVLLEKPDVLGPVVTPRPQLLMADAYKLLHDITHKHNVSVKLDLSPSKKLFVTIRRGSLETTTEALHPHMRHKSMRYLKAGYTAGSMAGLGFSMAILGTCVGIFIGFLLWKRHSHIPYQVTA